MTNINDETPSTITITISTIVTPGKKAATPHILGGNRGPSLVTLVAPCMGKVNMVIIIIITIIKVTTVIHIIIILYSMIMIVILITVILAPLSPSPIHHHHIQIMVMDRLIRPDTKKKMAADLQSFLQVKTSTLLPLIKIIFNLSTAS